jgi:transposase
MGIILTDSPVFHDAGEKHLTQDLSSSSKTGARVIKYTKLNCEYLINKAKGDHPMPGVTINLIHPQIKVNSVEGNNPIIIHAEFIGQAQCPVCDATELRTKDCIERKLRHESIGRRNTWLHLKLRKYQCLKCGRYFRARVPGVMPYRRSTEMFRKEIFHDHKDGISQKQLQDSRKIGSATIERWFHDFLKKTERKLSGRVCPRVLGIDEHFFSKKDGYVTTFCDLEKHKVFDLAKGRSEKSLAGALMKLKGRHRVKVVCIDLSVTYRSIVKKYFPNARIVTDRFHVIRIIQQHFLDTWKILDPAGRKNRGLLSLMRRKSENLKPEQKLRLQLYLKEHPALEIIYEAKQAICLLLNIKSRTAKQAKKLIPKFLRWIELLKETPFTPLQTLADTLESWQEEIVRMWRFTRNNGITEGFHTKMELIQRRAYGFRNFENYRLRVIVLCS